MDSNEQMLSTDNLMDVFLTDPDLSELWFDAAEREAVRDILMTRAEGVSIDQVEEDEDSSGIWEDELVKVTVSPDEMSAFIEIQPQLRGIETQALGEFIEHALQAAAITHGIRRRQLERLVENPIYDKKILAAQGTAPREDNENAIHLTFEHNLSIKPKSTDNYTVNVEQPDFIHFAHAGELLCTRSLTPPEATGMTVRGRKISSLNRTLEQVNPGENIRVSDDGCSLYALVDGEAVLQFGVLSVRPILRLQTVDANTGDIHFSGSIYITDSVDAGRNIEASGNIVVGGVVANSNLTAGGHLLVGKGIKGTASGAVKVMGSLRTPFLESTNVEVDGELYSDVLLASKVRCKGGVYALGKRGKIIGGVCMAREIVANELGNDAATFTALEIFSLQPMYERIKTYQQELESWQQRVLDMRLLIRKASTQARRAVLERLLEQLLEKEHQIKNKILQTTERMDQIKSSYSFEIKAHKAVYPNLSCTILGQNLLNETAFSSSRIYGGKNGVRVYPWRSR